MAQPLKKKDTAKKPTLASFKEAMGLTNNAGNAKKPSNADKKMEWLIMPKAFQDALKLPGIPLSYVSTIAGHSNTGKSTLVNHAIVAAQRQKLIPVIYDTENNFDFTYAINMGMEATPVYGDIEKVVIDPETGEEITTTEYGIVAYEGNFLYFNNAILAARYGRNDYSKGGETAKCRKQAVIEDVAYSINELLDAQDEGAIQNGFVFIWDSVGSIDSWKTYNSKVGNPMFDAGGISASFNRILNDRIPRSRKVSEPYSNTMILVNKVWNDGMTNPVGPPSLELKGGHCIFYASRLIILMGGQLKASIKKLTATAKGYTYNYATQTKMKVIKNQLPSPYTLTYEGDIVCTPTGFIQADKEEIDAYKKSHISNILESLNQIAESSSNVSLDVDTDDITFAESEEEAE